MTFDPTSPPVPAGSGPRLGGRIRVEREDFEVEEIPQYLPCGEGEHLYVWIEKRGLTTPEAVRRLTRAAGVSTRQAGWAGYKDRHAVTRQWISLPRADVDRVRALSIAGLEVLDAIPHRNRLRTGHLRGNRFRIRVREAADPPEADVAGHLRRFATSGAPNGFGAQRFGTFGRNHVLGAALVDADPGVFLARIAEPVAGEAERVAAGRAEMAAGRPGGALKVLPPGMDLERHVAQGLLDGLEPTAIVSTLPRRARDFLLSAWQSACFNRVLDARLRDGRALVPGDVAMKLANGACFAVEDYEAEQPRAATLEIAATGPLPGRKMLLPSGDAARIESEALAAAGWSPDLQAGHLPKNTFVGARRALVAPLGGATVQKEAPGTWLFAFELPSGSFATAVLALFGVNG